MSTPAPLDPMSTVVGTASGPGLWIAPVGTAKPAAGAAPASPWASLGYASDDGVTQGGDVTTEQFTPWQSRSPIRSIITEKSRTVQFVLWELNPDTLGLYFDKNITAPAIPGDPLSFDVRSDEGGMEYAVLVDVADGDNSLRFYYPRATLDSTGDMAITKSSMVPLDVTLTALDLNGVMLSVDVDTPDAGALAAAAASAQGTTPGTTPAPPPAPPAATPASTQTASA